MKRYHSQGDSRKRKGRIEGARGYLRDQGMHSDRRDPECWPNHRHWNKRSPFDCGNPECGVCQNERYTRKAKHRKNPLTEEE